MSAAAAIEVEEESKENILPAVKGRGVKLDDATFNAMVASFQARIAACKGIDQIRPRIDFIQFLEIHYRAKEKRRGLLFEAVESFCKLMDQEEFKTDDVRNDLNCVSIWLHYAHMSNDPLEIYEFMKKARIGLRDPDFYIDWAFELERNGRINAAQDVFKLALENKVQPSQQLEEEYQAMLSRAVSCQAEIPEDEENQRKPLMSLRPVGKTRVRAPVARTGRAVLGLSCLNQAPVSTAPNNPLACYDDPDNREPVETNEDVVSFAKLGKSRENRVEVIPLIRGAVSGPVKVKAKPSFQIFCDDGEEEGTWKMPKLDIGLREPPKGSTHSKFNDSFSERIFNETPHSEAGTKVEEADAANCHMIYKSNSVSVEERLAMAHKHSVLTHEPIVACRRRFMKASSFEIGMGLWTVSPGLGIKDLPANTRFVLPVDVVEGGLSLEEYVFKKRWEIRSPSKIEEDARLLELQRSLIVRVNDSIAQLFSANPFSDEARTAFLDSVGDGFPKDRVFYLDKKMPAICLDVEFVHEGESYEVDTIVGEGSYGRVFRAAVLRKNPMEHTMFPMNDDVVFKEQKPPCPWELYICNELHKRLRSSAAYNIRPSIMKINRAYFFRDGCLLVSNFQSWGSLLSVLNNFLRAHKAMPECLVFCFAYEILRIIEGVHDCRIIHADLKVDNFVLAGMPRIDKHGKTEEEVFGVEGRSLQLIDFGRSIDMKFLPTRIQFNYCSENEEYRIPAMSDEQPWTYHIDYCGIASTIHTLLFGKHMKLAKVKDEWVPADVSFRRPLQAEFWKKLFKVLLNLPENGYLPKLPKLRHELFDCFMNSGRTKKKTDLHKKDPLKLLHPNSRKATRISKNANKQGKKLKAKWAGNAKVNATTEMLRFLAQFLEDYSDPFTGSDFLDLIEWRGQLLASAHTVLKYVLKFPSYLHRNDDEMDEITDKNSIGGFRKGRQKSGRLSKLQETVARETELFEGAGLDLPDLFHAESLEFMRNWDGDAKSIHKIRMRKVKRAQLEALAKDETVCDDPDAMQTV
ncbi:unnamed protein product [Notodromas monacha]|uniref:Mitotic checkpoint serine/threonine-protein kinase BUB1 beta n=1 Tax=Notodromas monacha TaxID=399045 RepID=A0A7R9BHR4_9CRUS|nr:unnamed protein product [Notodromas monacha]CAG0914126.1 unnamed protein product [Notodromas monacha]